MKGIVLVFLAWMTWSPLSAQTGSNDLTDAKSMDYLMFKENEFNFGKIPQGKPVTHVFEVMNTGNMALKIDNVQASCGCTTPEWDKEKPIAPGGTTKITVGYNAAAEGVFNKTITVFYGDNLTKQLAIKGEVWKTPASSAPSNKDLEDLKN